MQGFPVKTVHAQAAQQATDICEVAFISSSLASLESSILPEVVPDMSHRKFLAQFQPILLGRQDRQAQRSEVRHRIPGGPTARVEASGRALMPSQEGVWLLTNHCDSRSYRIHCSAHHYGVSRPSSNARHL